MYRKILLLILFILIAFFLWDRTSLSFGHYYSKGKKAYNASQYDLAIKYFNRALSVRQTDSAARLYYVFSLGKSEPTYYVQQALYEMSQSKINDPATQYAKQESIALRRELLKDLENNYIFNALSGHDIVRWSVSSFPLKIFIKNADKVPGYYIENLNKAIAQWTNRTSFIKFENCKNFEDANIVIDFKDINSDCKNDSRCHFTVAHTNPIITSGNLLKRMELTFSKTNPRGESYTPIEIYNTALHELGHTLGIMGHSDNPADVMYASNDKTSDIYTFFRPESQYLSMNDLRTVTLLYRLCPTVTNIRGYSKTNLYYPALILGQNDEILQKKLTELQKYINNYPNLASGYINISSVYANMGNFDMAFQSLQKAQTLAQSSDENYLIAYNRAILYFNNQQYKEALEYANQAKTFKNSNELEQLIEDINRFLHN